MWPDTRIVGLNYVFHPPEHPTATGNGVADGYELWSEDFKDLEEFFLAVERSEGFRAVMSRDVMAVAFYSQDDVEPQQDEDSG
jgi:hypothetical protein